MVFEYSVARNVRARDMTLNNTLSPAPPQTRPQSGSFRRHIGNGVTLLLLAAGLCAGQAQAQFVGFLPKLEASQGVGADGPLNVFDVRSECPSLAGGNVTINFPTQTINVPADATPPLLLTPWVTGHHPGWTCMRRFTYGLEYQNIPYAICGGQTSCILEMNTLIRHWLNGYMNEIRSTGMTLVDNGDTYLVLRHKDWIEEHPMVGLGFIVKWEGMVKGQPLSLPLGPGIEIFLAQLPGDISRYGPTVSIYHTSQPYFLPGAAANNYPAEMSVSFRMVLLTHPDNLKNSSANIFPVTEKVSLGYDFCQFNDAPNCILSETSFFNATANFYATVNVYHEIPTCTTPNIQVDMGMVKPSDFQGPGSKAGLKEFTLELNCASTIRRTVSYKLSSPTTKNAAQGLIAINNTSTASGIDVQILKSSAPDDVHPLDEDIIVHNWLGPAVQNLDIPLYAILRRFSDAPVGVGDYTAGATVVFSYN